MKDNLEKSSGKKLSNLAKRAEAEKQLEKYEEQVSEIQTVWANAWVTDMLRRYKKYPNREIYDEIVAETEAEAEKGKFHVFEEFLDMSMTL